MRTIIRQSIIIVCGLAIAAGGLAPIGRAQGSTEHASPVDGRSAESVEEKIERLRREGFFALYSLEYDEAGKRFDELVRVAPDLPQAYLFRATNTWFKSLFDRRLLSTSLYARDEFYAQKEMTVDPTVDRSFRADIAKAIELGEARVKSDPKNLDALYYLGAAHGSLAGYEATMARSFKSSMSHGKRSVDLHEKVVEMDPTYADAYLTIGMYHYVIGSLNFLVKMMLTLGGVRGSRKEGLQEIERVVAQGRRNADDARVILISLYARENRTNDTIAILHDMQKRYPKNFILLIEEANTLSRNERYEESYSVFDRLLEHDRATAKALDYIAYSYGDALRGGKAWERAIAEYAKVWTWKGADPDLVTLARLGAGQCYDALGKREKALEQYRFVQRRADVLDSRKRAEELIKKPYSPSAPMASTGQL